MPNHIHLLIEIINNFENQERRNGFSKIIPQSISSVIGAYKSSVTKRIRQAEGHGTPCPYENSEKPVIWQSRFYDHIIRNQADYERIWNYIDTNPLRWELDKYYAF